MSPGGHEPLACEEFGHGIGRPEGSLVLRYRSTGLLDLGSMRQDYLHQLSWVPDGLLAATRAGEPVFSGPGEAFSAGRGVEHEVRASGQAVVYRVCLREAPPALRECRAGAVRVEDGWARRQHGSTKTLQRDVECSFGLSWTRRRTRVRLHAARALLATQPVGATAARVGYASASAFVAAYAREFGRTPEAEVRA